MLCLSTRFKHLNVAFDTVTLSDQERLTAAPAAAFCGLASSAAHREPNTLLNRNIKPSDRCCPRSTLRVQAVVAPSAHGETDFIYLTVNDS